MERDKGLGLKILITGGTGFIGRHLALKLAQKKENEVFLLVRKVDDSFMQMSNIKQIQYKEIDAIHIKGIDVFYHMAWAGVSSRDKNDIDLQLENITLGCEMIRLAAKFDTKKFIAAGTVAEYTHQKGIMDFSERQTPSDIYGATKTAAYFLMSTYASELKVPFIWAVIPSTYGEGRNNDNILTYTITTLLEGKKPLYGKLDQIWDFLYIEDLITALELIGEKGYTRKVYGIGSGTYKTLNEYIEIIRDIINPHLELGIGEKKESAMRIESSCANINELVQDTGFTPKFSFEQGIRKTIEYYKNIRM